MTILARKAQLVAKLETTYGTVASPIPSGASNAVLTVGVQITPYAGETVSRNYDRAQLGNMSMINTNPGAEVSFGVELAGSGTAGTAPAWEPLLKACGFAAAAASPTGWSYAPISTSWPSVSLYLEIDGIMHEVLGARGTVSFTLARGQIPIMNFRFMGKYTRPYAGTHTGVSLTAYKSPIAVTNENTPTFTFAGKSFKAESFNLDMANNLVHRNVINGNEVMITDRAPAGSFVVETPDLDDSPSVNLFSYVESHSGVTTGAFVLEHGITTGNIVRIAAPAVQLSANAYGNSDGIHTSNLTALFLPVSGNDEVSITTR